MTLRKWAVCNALSIVLSATLPGASLALAQKNTTPGGMTQIPGGTYLPFYAIKRKPVHVPTYELDIYPVSNQDFLGFVHKHPRWRKSQVKRIFASEQYLQYWPEDLHFPPQQAKAPVTYVSWFAAKAYCRAQGKQLPTGDQWEYAARANESQTDASGDPKFRQRILDWYAQTSPQTLPPVGSTYRNAYGIYDMHGLIWEWVLDYNTVMITGESREDSGIDRKLFCAGGATSGADPSDYAAYMRFAFRSSLKADYSLKNLGFRCARKVD